MPLDTTDRLDLLDLYARYSLLFDDGRHDDWAALFCSDGHFQITDGPGATGTNELAAFAAKMYGRNPGIRHVVTNICLDSAPAGATGRAYVLALSHGADGSLKVLTLGSYEDQFAKVEAGWRFSRRTFTPWADMASPGATVLFAL